MATVALVACALLGIWGPFGLAFFLVVRRANANARRLRALRAQLAHELAFALEGDDAICGSSDGHFVRVVWSKRNATGNLRGGGRPVTYCELSFDPLLELHLAISTGWPWGGRKRKVDGIRPLVSTRCDDPLALEAILRSLATVANALPDPLTFEIDDATVRIFVWGHATDANEILQGVRFTIQLGTAVTEGLTRSPPQRRS